MAKIAQLKNQNGEDIYPAIAKEQILDMFYPVGTIYETTVIDNVADIETQFGGTWEVFGSGQVLVAVDEDQLEFSAIEKTGGEKTHQLTVSELPQHNHNFESGRWAWAERAGGGDIINSQSETSYKFTRTTANTGSNTPHNNLQPYITCYRYKRIA